MRYSIFIERYAQKQIMKLDKQVIPQIKKTISTLADDPRSHHCKKLKGEDAWRIRTGNFRIIYEIDDEEHIVTIISVGHRKDIYRK